MERGTKILLVDDESEFIAEMQAKLMAKDWQVLTASNRLQAEEVARHEKPDLVILGTIVPRGDAFRLHQWLKQSPDLREVPLIVVDAPPEKRLTKGWRMDEGLKLEAEQYLIKPVDSASVLAWAERFLDKTLRKIKVLVVDDHAVVREGICALLSLQKDMEVVGEAVDGQDAIDKVQRLTPNVAVMDIIMPVMSGLEATKRITKECPETKVLILTQYDEEENMFVAKQVGAYGFIAKSAASSDLLTGIRTVGEGRYFPRSFAYVSANWPEGLDKNR
ncbi:MAG: response regulator [Chloroflexi bacterium]|jgi:DNA-binding NarL/FixJ family response regulator|nr:response regulator [Chloroflexota bacterium]